MTEGWEYRIVELAEVQDHRGTVPNGHRVRPMESGPG